MKRVFLCATAAILFAGGGASLVAHHPFSAEYDWKKPVTVTGTVTKLEWKNPHAELMVKGQDENGNNADWMVELGGTDQLRRMGWTKQQFKAGEQITVDGWLAKDGTKKLSAKSVTLPNGRELFAASSFFSERGRTRETAATTGKR